MSQEIKINILLKEEEGLFVARCPQMGILATDSNRADVLRKIERLISRQITYAQKTRRMGEVFHTQDTVEKQ